MHVTIGRYDYSLDPKNRLVVPGRYREALLEEKGRHFIMAVGLDRCIWLFLPSQWEAFLEDSKTSTRDMKGEKARAVKRHIFSSAIEAELDEQGRLLVPQHLKEHAGLKKDVVVSGAGNKAEIWDSKSWEAYSRKQAGPSFESLAADLDL